MSDLDIIGYVCDGDVYCKECIDDNDGEPTCDCEECDGDKGHESASAVFEYSSESDSPTHCGQCRQFLRNRLTKEGFEDLVERIQRFEHEFWPDRIKEYMDHWDWFDWYVIPTFLGRMDPLGNYKRSW